MHKGRNFSRVVGGGGGGDLKEDWLGLYCWNAWILTLFKAKCIQIATLFRTLNSEIKYFFEHWRSHKPLPCSAAHTEWPKHRSFPTPKSLSHYAINWQILKNVFELFKETRTKERNGKSMWVIDFLGILFFSREVNVPLCSHVRVRRNSL